MRRIKQIVEVQCVRVQDPAVVELVMAEPLVVAVVLGVVLAVLQAHELKPPVVKVVAVGGAPLWWWWWRRWDIVCCVIGIE
jgi:hypothetical protein